MVEIIFDGGKLILQRRGLGKGTTEQISFPLENVAGATANPFLAQNWVRKQKFLAAYIPRAAKPGTQFEDDDCIFWEIENPNKTIVIYLENEFYNKIVVEVKEPHRAVCLIEQTLAELYNASQIKELNVINEVALNIS